MARNRPIALGVIVSNRNFFPDIFVTQGRSHVLEAFGEKREEILRHKWIESEKAGYDIGFERAMLDWTIKHSSTWREYRRKATQS